MAKKKQITKQVELEGGGAHQHGGDPLAHDGLHSHIFVLNGHVLKTEADGAHAHPDDGHVHAVRVGEDLMDTMPGGVHDHVQKSAKADGRHSHKLELLDGTVVESLMPEDLLDAQLRKKLKLDIQAVAMSKDRFLTFEKAAAWLDEQGMQCEKCDEHASEFVFAQMPRELFEESSLKTVEMADGVRAVVGLLKEGAEEHMKPHHVEPEELAFDELQGLIVAEAEILTDAQAAQLAQLREELALSMAVQLQAAVKAIPLLSAFIESVLGSSVGDQAMMALVDRVAANALALKSIVEKVKLPEVTVTEDSLADLVAGMAFKATELEEAFEDTSFDRLHLLFKSCRLTFARASEEVWKRAESSKPVAETPALDQNQSSVQKVLVPTKSMSRAEKQECLKNRGEAFGIEITEDASLMFPAGSPTELEKFGDPVNLKFPCETAEKAASSRKRLKKFAQEIYKSEQSVAKVHERIVRLALAAGCEVEVDKADPLDALLPSDILAPAEPAHLKNPAQDAEQGEGVEKKWFVPIKKAAGEQRIVHGIVLEPDVTDLHGDTYDEETVRDAAFTFMEDFMNPGLMHEELIEGKVRILESFVAPVHLNLPIEGGTFTVRKGTWLMTWRIKDEELWSKVKAGELTGFSIGAKAMVTNLRK